MIHSFTAAMIVLLPTQFIFLMPKQMEMRICQTRTLWWVWQDSPAKMGSVLHHLRTGMGPGAIMLQGKVIFFSCLTLEFWAFSLVSIMMQQSRVDVLFGFQEIQKDHPFPIPKESTHYFTHWGLHLELFLWWGIHRPPLYGLPFWLWLLAVTSHLVTGNDAIQETSALFNRS